jgi:serine/threonine protein phosphatase 1
VISIRRETYNLPRPAARAGEKLLYAIGDIHGCYDLLHALLGAIGRDAAERYPGVTPTLVLCGDYVDRGPDSAKVLTALTWLMRSSAVELYLLEGNHEAMLLGFLDNPTEYGKWLSVDGFRTLQSYGIEVSDKRDAATLKALRNSLLDAMPISHRQLLHDLRLIVEVGDYAFVHAGVMPGVPLRAQSRNALLWIGAEFLEHPNPATSVIVHGHTWVDEHPTLLPHRIGIDTGAYKTDVLTGIRIGNDFIEVIQATGPNSQYG